MHVPCSSSRGEELSAVILTSSVSLMLMQSLHSSAHCQSSQWIMVVYLTEFAKDTIWGGEVYIKKKKNELRLQYVDRNPNNASCK